MKSFLETESVQELVQELGFAAPILVTRPTLPPLERFHESLEAIWRSRWLTNGGEFHQRLERGLAERLDVSNVSLFCNGTIALLVALQALRVSGGEVITTPFTFPATPHVLHWNGVTPVFCDIDPITYNLDAEQLEPLITSRTQAILPVHVFGNPCDVEALARIGDRHGLRIIYDGAHAFGVRVGGRSVASFGDLTMLSFHATKLFTSIEGGALVAPTTALKSRIDFLKNFGIADEETVIGPGINGKLNEVQSAFGLLQLELVGVEVAARRTITQRYRALLGDVPGLRLQADLPGVEHNYAYLPVLVDEERFGLDRDELHAALKLFGVHARKYFHPLCSHIPSYRALPSAAPERLPIAERVARQVLCLPIYGTLPLADVEGIARIVRELHLLALRG